MNEDMATQMIAHTLMAVAKQEEAELDAKMHELEGMDDDDLERLRAKRIRQMKAKRDQKLKYAMNGHGKYTEVHSEKEFFDVAKKSRKIAIHFYRPTTKHCWVIDKHFEKLCREHMSCRFVKINAEKSPYLSKKLNIWMLPTIVVFIDGKEIHKIVGFDELGGTDKFTKRDMATVLANWGAIELEA